METNGSSGRIIGIRPRVLKTTLGEKRPTQVTIIEHGKQTFYELETEEDEVHFIVGKYPVFWEVPNVNRDVGGLPEYYKRWKKVKSGIEPNVHASQKKSDKKGSVWHFVNEIATVFNGVKPGDHIAMTIGGEGNLIATEITEYRGVDQVQVWRITPGRLKDQRELKQLEKDEDSRLLAELLQHSRDLFYLERPLEVTLVRLNDLWRQRDEAQKDRIATGNQLYPQARREAIRAHLAEKAVIDLDEAHARILKTNKLYQQRVALEEWCNKQLAETLGGIPIWREYLSQVEGIGSALGARYIAGIGDFRSFIVEPDAVAIATIKTQLDTACELGKYREGKAAIGEQIISTAANGFERMVLVRNWYRDGGDNEKADHLSEAIKLMKHIAKIKRKAYQKGMNRFVAVAGAHVLSDGTFPRHRRGTRCNWRPELRQGLYLVDDQLNRRPNSVWGIKRLENKARLRQRHPVPVVVDKETGEIVEGMDHATAIKSKKYVLRYTDGHIHRMARWRTGTQFIRRLFREYYRIYATQN